MNDKGKTLILVINPGGTSTKVALYDGEDELLSRNLVHADEELAAFDTIIGQLNWRAAIVERFLRDENIAPESLAAVVGRGGPVAPVPSGTFVVDEPMLEAIATGRVQVQHPSLLGAPLAKQLADRAVCPAYIVDPVCVDEYIDEARLTGLPEITRHALSHALNVKAAARRAAAELGKDFHAVNLIVLHLGSGFTVAAQKKGRQIDANDASASGPMAPTRSGDLPVLDFARLCYSGRMTLAQMEKRLVGGGGWVAHLGTHDLRIIEKRIEQGDKKASMVIAATIHQLIKQVGAMAATLGGDVDGIVFTGGVAYQTWFIEELKKRVGWICDRFVTIPGENEMLALAQGALRALRGDIEAESVGPYIDQSGF